MKKIQAHCHDDQKLIDEVMERIDELQKNYEKLKKEFDEYKIRHPENVGIKNGKPYFFNEAK